MVDSEQSFEISPPLFVDSLERLEDYCELLNRNHLGEGKFEYHGLHRDIKKLVSIIDELKKFGYVVKSIRQHCISGVVLRSVNPSESGRYRIVGIGLQKIGETSTYKNTIYIDYVFDVVNPLDKPYKSITALQLNGIKDLIDPNGNYHERTSNGPLWKLQERSKEQ